MNIKIGYSELSEYIQQHFDKEVALAYIDKSTVAVTASVKLAFVPLSATLNLHIDSIVDTQINLSYTGRRGVDLMVTGLVKFLESRPGGIPQFIQYKGDSRIAVMLDRIDQLRSALNHVQLCDIIFNESGADVVVALK